MGIVSSFVRSSEVCFLRSEFAASNCCVLLCFSWLSICALASGSALIGDGKSAFSGRNVPAGRLSWATHVKAAMKARLAHLCPQEVLPDPPGDAADGGRGG